MAPQREWFEKDYYKVLGVPDTATPKDITRRTESWPRVPPRRQPGQRPPRSGSRRSPPPTTSSATPRSARSTTRSARWARRRRLRRRRAGGGHGPAVRSSFRVGDLGDLLGNLFGRGGRRRRPGAGGRPAARARPRDRAAPVLRRRRRRRHHARCTSPARPPATPATAAAPSPGTAPRRLPALPRPGRARRQPGLVLVLVAVPGVRRPGHAGRGPVPHLPRQPVSSAGPARSRSASPPASTDGQRIRLKGRGGPGRNGGPPGDLYVVVPRRPRTRCSGVDGRNLTLTVPVTFPEAALGADVKVPTLDDGPVTLRLPAGTRSGRTFRVKGRGVGAEGAGDLLVTVEVAVPPKLSRAERKAVEALAAADDRVAPRPPGGVRTMDDRRRPSAPGTAPSTSSPSPPSWPGVHPQTLRIYERKGLRRPGPHRRRQPPLQRRRTSPCCAASRSSPTRA